LTKDPTGLFYKSRILLLQVSQFHIGNSLTVLCPWSNGSQ